MSEYRNERDDPPIDRRCYRDDDVRGPRNRYDDDDVKRGPAFPSLASIAGSLWIAVGVLIVLDAIFDMIDIAQANQQAKANQNQDEETAMVFLVVFVSLIAGVFVFAGIQTVKGAAKDLMGFGVGSIIFSLLFFAGGMISLDNGDFQEIFVCFFFGVGMLAPGVLAIRARADYWAWRRFYKKDLRKSERSFNRWADED